MFALEIIKRLLVSIPSLYVADRIKGYSHEIISGESVIIDRTAVGIILGEGVPAAIVVALIIYWFSLAYVYPKKPVT